MTDNEVRLMFWKLMEDCLLCCQNHTICVTAHRCVLGKDKELEHIIQTLENDAYNKGVTAYAWWKDGVQQVGTCGTLLKDALRKDV